MNRLLIYSLILIVASSSIAQEKDKEKSQSKGPFSEARQRLQRGNIGEAREQYQKLIKDEKLRVPALIGISRTYQAEGEYAKALDTINEGLKNKADANHPDLLATKADYLYLLGKWDDAIQNADLAIKVKKDHFLARWVKAQIIRDKGDWTSADKELLWFVRTYTDRSNADNDITDLEELLIVGQAGTIRANWHNLSDQFGFILNTVYNDALKYDPDCWQAEYLAGMLLLDKYNRPDAVAAFDKVLKINPKAAEAFVGKGLAALVAYEIKEADTFADQALKFNPNLVSALRLKADVHLATGEILVGRKLLLKALEINPRDEVTLGKLAACQFALKLDVEFKQIVAGVEKFNSKPSLFYLELANALEDRKLYQDAETFFKKSMELRDKLPGPRAGLGMLYLRLGKETEAKELLTKAFDNDKFNVRLANSLKVLRHLEKYETIKTKHYDLRYDPKTDKVLAEFVAEYLEEVHEELVKAFGHKPKQRFLFELFNSHEMFSGRTVALPDLHTIGACTGRVVTMASPKAKGVAKPFNWGRVIRHELVHIFNLDQTEFRVPHWLTEGLAVRNEKLARPPMWTLVLREHHESDTLLNLDNIQLAFVRPRSQEQWTLAYCQSQIYVDYVSETFGQKAIGDMLNGYRDGLDDAAIIKQVCKMDKEDFEKGYQKFVTHIVKSTPSGNRKTEKTMTLEELEKAHEKKPDDVDIAARLADQYFRRKRPADARKFADEVLKKKLGHPLASIVKSRLLNAGGEAEQARELVEKAYKENPNDPKLIAILSRFCRDAKEYSEAAKLLEQGRKVAPLESNWLEQLAEMYTDLKENEKLTIILKEIAANDADDLETRLKAGNLLLKGKKPLEAQQMAEEALQIDVMNETARKLLIDSLTEQGKTDQAEKIKKRFGDQ